MYCLHCGHSLIGLPSFKCPECGWPFNPDDRYSYADRRFDPTTAALLEIAGGVFQVFGPGHMYGRFVGRGLSIMLGWWGLLLLIGFVASLTGRGAILLAVAWLTTCALSAYWAAQSASFPRLPQYPSRPGRGGPRG